MYYSMKFIMRSKLIILLLILITMSASARPVDELTKSTRTCSGWVKWDLNSGYDPNDYAVYVGTDNQYLYSYSREDIQFSLARGSHSVTINYTSDANSRTRHPMYLCRISGFSDGTSSGRAHSNSDHDPCDDWCKTVYTGGGCPSNPQPVGTSKFSISDKRLTEGNSGTKNFTFTVSLDKVLTKNSYVYYKTSNGSARSGEDYNAVSNQYVYFYAGEKSHTVSIEVKGDTKVEPDETFYVDLYSPNNAEIDDGHGVGTIRNDDSASGGGGGTTPSNCEEVKYSTSYNTWVKANSSPSSYANYLNMSKTIRMDGASKLRLKITGNTESGYDYLYLYDENNRQVYAGSGYHNAAGDISGSAITMKLTSDGSVNASGVTVSIEGLGCAQAAPKPNMTITSSRALPEGNSGTKNFTFTVSLDKSYTQAITVKYKTTNGSALSSEDYEALSLRTLTFNAGQTSKTITVKVKGDTKVENDETFYVDLSSATNATITGSRGTGTIQNDDTPAMSITNRSLTEGNSGTKNFNFTVSLDKASNKTVTVKYKTTNGSALSGEDYEALSLRTLTFSAGQTSKTVTVKVKGDIFIENDETFYVDLSSITNATIADSRGLGTILNDDSNIGSKFSCTQESYLTTGKSSLYSLNLSTGESKTLKENYTSNSINAIGYNVKDNYIWGWDLDAKKVARIDKNYHVNLYNTTVPTAHIQRNVKSKNGYTSGDVSKEGYLYLSKPSLDHKIHKFNLNSGLPVYEGAVMLSNTSIHFGDFSINPKDGYLYTTASKILYRINPNDGVVTNLGNISGLVDSYFHSYVFDSDGNLYFYSDQNDKKVFKLDLSNFASPDRSAEVFSTLTWITGMGDGARCANAKQDQPAKIIADYHFDECYWNGTSNEVKNKIGTVHGKAYNNLNTQNGGKIQRSGLFKKSEKHYIDFGDNYDITGDKIAISVWFRSNSTNGEQIIYNKESKYELAVKDGYLKYAFRPHWSWDGGTSFPVTPNTWYHVVITYDGNKQRMYRNGVEVYNRNQTGDITGNSYHLLIGARNSTSPRNFFDGRIDEFKIFDNTLSPTKVKSIYENEKVGKDWNGETRKVITCQEAFTCTETLYLSNRSKLGTGNTDSGRTWLHSINRDHKPYSFTSIGNGFFSSNGGYNALAYNVKDNFMYGLYGNHLMKIDKNALVIDLGAISGLVDHQLYAGEFDRDGYYYITGRGGNDNTMYKVDVKQNKIIKTITLSRYVKFWDIAIDSTGKYFYTMLIKDNANGKFINDHFAKININSGQITTIGGSKENMPVSDSTDLIFSDKENNVYLMSDSYFSSINTQTGEIFHIDSTPALTFYNDGTSCPNATIYRPSRISISDISLTEGNSGLKNFTFTVKLDKSSTKSVTVKYKTTNGSALSGEDYNAIPLSTLTFNTGETSKTIVVQVKGDIKVENDEVFYLDFSSATNGIIQTDRIKGTIKNDDSYVLNVNDLEKLEGSTGLNNFTIPVSLNQNAPTGGITLTYTPDRGTVSNDDMMDDNGMELFGEDSKGDHNDDGHADNGNGNQERNRNNKVYKKSISPQNKTKKDTAKTFSITIPAGQKVANITIPVNGDTTYENDETFYLTFTNPSNTTMAKKRIIIKIINDDKKADPKEFTCSSDAYLFTGSTTSTAYSINLTSGAYKEEKNAIPHKLNALGYNIKDNFIWGYDLNKNKIIKIDANYNVTTYNVANLPKLSYYAGDVSSDGFLYLKTHGDNGKIHKIDLNSGIPIYKDFITLTNKNLRLGDFAFNPVDNMIYAVSESNAHLYKINPKSGKVDDLGEQKVNGKIHFHTHVFDRNGNLYFYGESGYIYQISSLNSTPKLRLFSTVNIKERNGDGVKCAYAEKIDIKNIGEFRFDDCGNEEWKIDHSPIKNDAQGSSAKIVNDDAKTYMCNSINPYHGDRITIPHHSAYELAEGTISMLLYDHHNTWASAWLLHKGDFGMEVHRVDNNEHKGTVTVHIPGGSIATNEVYFTNSNDHNDFDSQWIQVTFTFGKEGMKLYINGEEKGSHINTRGIQNIKEQIELTKLSGFYDELYILKGQMSDKQVKQMYQNTINNKNLDGTDRTCGCDDSHVVSINDIRKDEGDMGYTNFKFTVNIAGGAPANASFKMRVLNGTNANADKRALLSDNDFKSGQNRTINVPLGAQTVDINIWVKGDTKIEQDEEFSIELYDLVNLRSGDLIGLGTIANDDSAQFRIERVDSDKNDNSTYLRKKSFYTQISGRKFNYAVVAYTDDNNAHLELPIKKVTVKVELIDNNDSSILNTQFVTFPISGSPREIANEFTINRAVKNATFKVTYPLSLGNFLFPGPYALAPNYQSIEMASDNFAIRPAAIKLRLNDMANTIKSNDRNTPIRLAAGYNYRLSADALLHNDNNNVARNYTTQGSDINTTLAFRGNPIRCRDTNDNNNYRYNFTNGSSVNNNFSFNNVSNYQLQMRDSNWTNIDQSIPAANSDCIVGSSQISSSYKTKSGCTISSNQANGARTYSDINTEFYPFQYNLSNFRLDNLPNSGHNDFLYMSSLTNTNNMSIRIRGDILPQAQGGVITTNYTDGCAAEAVALNITYNGESEFGQFNNAIREVLPTSIPPHTTRFRRVQQTIVPSGANINNNNAIDLNSTINIPANAFFDGNATTTLFYNIDKPLNETVNPVHVNFQSINASSIPARSVANGRNPFTPTGVAPLNANRTFYFTRVKPEKSDYGVTYGNSEPTPLSIQIFCDHNRTWCGNMIGSNGLNTKDGTWYTSVNHVDPLDGDVLTLNDSNNRANVPLEGLRRGKMPGLRTSVVFAANEDEVKTHVTTNETSWLSYDETDLNGHVSWDNTFRSTRPIEWSGVGQVGNIVNNKANNENSNKMDW